jgi:hypothetical protein
MRNFEEFYEKLQTGLRNQPKCPDHPEYPCVRTLIQEVPNDIIKIESEGITVRSYRTENNDIISKEVFRDWYTWLFEERRTASLNPDDNQNNPNRDRSRIVGAIIAKCFPDIIKKEDGGRAIRLDGPDR